MFKNRTYFNEGSFVTLNSFGAVEWAEKYPGIKKVVVHPLTKELVVFRNDTMYLPAITVYFELSCEFEYEYI